MPRVADIYNYPPGTPGVPDTTIESVDYNAYIDDIKDDLNLPRPIIAGGTAAADATTALANLGGEKAKQQVTNYDALPTGQTAWLSGSFYSAAGATNAPSANACVGVVAVQDANNMVLVAVDLTTNTTYQRNKSAGAWSAWTTQPTTADVATRVAKAGDTMSGDLAISKATPALILDKATAGQTASVTGRTNGLKRWDIIAGDTAAESGGNAGSNFAIACYNDAGAIIDAPFTINRATARVSVSGDPTAPLGVATKQYVDNTNPVPASTAPLGLANPPGFVGSSLLYARADHQHPSMFQQYDYNGLAVGVDLNTVTDNGLYRVNAPVNGPPGPADPWYHLYVQAGNAGYVVQICYTYTVSPPQIWIRSEASAGVWSSWNKVIDTAQIASAAQILGNASADWGRVPNVYAMWQMLNMPTLSDASGTITMDLNTGVDFYLPLNAAGRTMANPVNGKAGQRGIIMMGIGGAGYGITTWGSYWKFPGGVKPVNTSPGGYDVLSYFVQNPTAWVAGFFSADMK